MRPYLPPYDPGLPPLPVPSWWDVPRPSLPPIRRPAVQAAAAFAVHRGQIAEDDTTYDATSSGFGTPQGYYMFASLATADDTRVNDACLSAGFGDLTNEACLAAVHVDNLTSDTETRRYKRTDHSLYLTDNVGSDTPVVELTYSTTVTDGVRFSVTETLGAGQTLDVTTVLFKGFSSVSVDEITTDPDQNDSVEVNTGSPMDCGIVLGARYNGTGAQQVNGGAIGIGFWADQGASVEHGLVGWFANNNQSNGGQMLGDASATYAAVESPNNVTGNCAFEFASLDSTNKGYTVTTRLSTQQNYLLCLSFELPAGQSATVQTGASPTSTGNQNVSLGFVGQSALGAFSNATALHNSNQTVQTICAGAVVGDTEYCHYAWGEDAPAGSVSNAASYQNSAFLAIRDNSENKEAECTASFSSTNLVLNWGTVDGTNQYRYAVLVFETAGQDLVEVVNETEQASEGSVRSLDLLRILAETEQASEGSVASRTLARVLAETEQVSETSGRALALARIIDEAVQVSESPYRVVGIIRQIAESLSLSEDVVSVRGLVEVLSETTQVAEAVIPVRTLARAVVETLNAAEARLVVRALARVVGESQALSEARVSVRDLVRILDETGSISELPAVVLALSRVTDEAVQVPEALAYVLGLVQIISETVQYAESVVRSGAIFKVLAETVQVGESAVRVRVLVRVIDAVLQAVEAITAARALVRYPGSSGDVILYDTFTDDDLTLLPDHTPDVDTVGGGWSQYASQGRILNNAQDGLCNSWIDIGTDRDFRLTCRARLYYTASAASTCAWFLRNGGGLGNELSVKYTGSGTDNTGRFGIFEGNTEQTGEDVAVDDWLRDGADTYYNVEVTLAGDDLTAILKDGATVLSTLTHTSTVGAGNTHLRLYGRFGGDSTDDLLITELGDPGESLSLSEAYTAARDRVRQSAETVQAVEAALRVVGLARSIGEAVALATDVVRSIGLLRVRDDVINLSETSARIRTLFRVVDETVQVAEAAARYVAINRVRSETVTTSETSARSRTLSRIVNDALSIAEAVLQTLELVRVLALTVAIGEAVNSQRGIVQVIDESLQIAEDAIKGLLRIFELLADITVEPLLGASVTIAPKLQGLITVVRKMLGKGTV